MKWRRWKKRIEDETFCVFVNLLYDCFDCESNFVSEADYARWITFTAIFRYSKQKSRKVPRGIRSEKSSKDTASSANLVATNWSKSQKRGSKPGVRKGKRSLLACQTRCKCSIETTRNSVKVNLGIKVITFVESLIGWEVTVSLVKGQNDI